MPHFQTWDPPTYNIYKESTVGLFDNRWDIEGDQPPYPGTCDSRTRISNNQNPLNSRRRRLPHFQTWDFPRYIIDTDNRIWGDHTNYNERVLATVCPMGENQYLFHTKGIDDCQEPFLDELAITVNNCAARFRPRDRKYKERSGVVTMTIYVCHVVLIS